jgi:MFS family permease
VPAVGEDAALSAASADLRILFASAFLRALATGMLGVLLGVHLATLGLTPAGSGLVVGLGLAGAAGASLLATFGADRIGRRRFLAGLALLSAAGGAAAAVVTSPVGLSAVAFVGMLNGMGRDRGAALVLEQAALPGAVADAGRTRAFAVYNVLQDAGHALGSLLAGLPVVLQRGLDLAVGASFQWSLALYALLCLLVLPLCLRLSPAVETPGGEARAVSPASRRVLVRIGALFAVDSVAGGFLTTALLSFFFYERFGVGADRLGLLFFAARAANALSHLGAAWLAGRIGLLNTMVFTHIPSSLLLVTVAFAPSFAVAAALFLLREGLVEMDVPTRQSYVMAVVRPEERTFASGVTHLVRMGGWAVAPAFAGLLMQGLSLLTPLLVGAAMKIGYDVMLYFGFRGTVPPEERGAA